jgi:plastocyanin
MHPEAEEEMTHGRKRRQMHDRKRRRRSPELLALALVLLVALGVLALLAGCGGGGTPATTAGSAAPGSTQATGGGTASSVPPGATEIVMKNIKFMPADVTIKVGQTVAWTNEDGAQHDVVANDGTFKSDLLSTGQVFTFTFSKAGTYPYYCSIHPQMQGTITVQP